MDGIAQHRKTITSMQKKDGEEERERNRKRITSIKCCRWRKGRKAKDKRKE